MDFALLFAPVALLLLIHLLDFIDTSSIFNCIFDFIFDVAALFNFFPYLDCRRHLWSLYRALWPREGDGGSSPWGVAAAVVLLIVLASLHSAVLDMLGP